MKLSHLLPPAKPVDDTQRAFERTLAHEILVSERLRVTLLLGILGVVFVVGLLAFALLPQVVNELFRGQLTVLTLLTVIGPAVIYEALVFVAITFALRTQRQPPLIARYVNALVEMTFPTIILWLATTLFPPVEALTAPPLLFYAAFVVLATLRLDFWLCAFTGLVAGGEYIVLALSVISRTPSGLYDPLLVAPVQHIGKGLILLGLGVVAGFVAQQIRRQFIATLRTIEERNRVINMFGQHVSPVVAEKLLAQGVEAPSEVRHVCMMFVDIRDFTTFAEKTTPGEVVHYLNALFAFMIDCVNEHHGIVNKFLGDGFMAVFGAPLDDDRHVGNAVEAAREILSKVNELNASGQFPHTRIGIGLHAGEAVTGNVGSASRKEYTIIGDVVNVASRIEQLNKQFGSQLLVSEVVWEVVGGVAMDVEALGAVQVKGHEAPVQVYKLA